MNTCNRTYTSDENDGDIDAHWSYFDKLLQMPSFVSSWISPTRSSYQYHHTALNSGASPTGLCLSLGVSHCHINSEQSGSTGMRERKHLCSQHTVKKDNRIFFSHSDSTESGKRSPLVTVHCHFFSFSGQLANGSLLPKPRGHDHYTFHHSVLTRHLLTPT